jgi:hypothetical protein
MDKPHPRQLKIDLTELEIAFENSDWEVGYYLDLESGEIIMVQENTFRDLENIYSEYEYVIEQEDDEDPEPLDLSTTLQSMDLHDWERDMLLQANLVRNGLNERFVRVPLADSHEAFNDMEQFLEKMENQSTRMRLNQAMRGKNPFRRFKDTLQSYPQERERWHAFKRECTQARILNWLQSINIQAI